jgi:hypothetical protein
MDRTEKIIARAEYGDVHLSLSPKLGAMPNRAFRECALERFFCIQYISSAGEAVVVMLGSTNKIMICIY